jgi:hypothetical protein
MEILNCIVVMSYSQLQCGLGFIQETIPLPIHRKRYRVNFFEDGTDDDRHTVYKICVRE